MPNLNRPIRQATEIGWMRRIESKIEELGRGIRNPSGKLIDSKAIWGISEGYGAVALSEPLYADHAKTIPLRLVFTPEVDAWLVADLLVGLIDQRSPDFYYCSITMALSPAPSGLPSNAAGYNQLNSTAQRYGAVIIPATQFPLSAGVTYTLSTTFFGSGGTWFVHNGDNVLRLSGMLYAR